MKSLIKGLTLILLMSAGTLLWTNYQDGIPVETTMEYLPLTMGGICLGGFIMAGVVYLGFGFVKGWDVKGFIRFLK